MPSKRAWSGKSRGGYFGNWFLLKVVSIFGIRAAYLLLYPIAAYFVLVMGKARRASLEYLRKIDSHFGLRHSFRHFFTFGQVLLDRFAISLKPQKLKLTQEGLDNISAALADGRGLVMLSAHVGAWESMARLLGGKMPVVNVVMFRNEAENIQKMSDAAQKGKFNIIAITGGPQDSLAINAALTRGEIVAIHGDRSLAGQGIKVPFLGQEAAFPPGPFIIAATTGAPLVYTLSAREGLWQYRTWASSPLHFKFTSRAARQADLARWVGEYAATLEAWMRRYPYQWFNFFSFWGE